MLCLGLVVWHYSPFLCENMAFIVQYTYTIIHNGLNDPLFRFKIYPNSQHWGTRWHAFFTVKWNRGSFNPLSTPLYYIDWNIVYIFSNFDKSGWLTHITFLLSKRSSFFLTLQNNFLLGLSNKNQILKFHHKCLSCYYIDVKALNIQMDTYFWWIDLPVFLNPNMIIHVISHSNISISSLICT